MNKPNRKNNSGFTVIEMLVVFTISVYLTMSLINGAVKNKLNIPEEARIILSDLRRAQADALSSKQYNGTHRCGYGLHMVTTNQVNPGEVFGQVYYIYTNKAGPNQNGNCPGSFSYQPNDVDIITSRFLDYRLELCNQPTGPLNSQNLNPPSCGSNLRFEDVFFAVPKGEIYIRNQRCIGSTPRTSQIIIRKKGATCPSNVNCSYICIYADGRIQQQSTPCANLTC